MLVSPQTYTDIAVSLSFVGEEEVYELLWTELLTLDYQPISDLSEMTEGMKVMAPWICDEKTVMTEATILSLDPGMYCEGCVCVSFPHMTSQIHA